MITCGENPAQSVAMVGRAGKLFGVQLNDGYGRGEDGLMFASVSIFSKPRHQFSDGYCPREDRPGDAKRYTLNIGSALRCGCCVDSDLI
jgi:hypothetical protein